MSFSQIRSHEELLEIVTRRRGEGAKITNFVFTDRRFEQAVREGGLLTGQANPGAVFLFRDRVASRIYFMSRSADELRDTLSAHRADFDDATIIDVLGNAEAVMSADEPIRISGFSRYKRFQRMVRLSHNGSQSVPERVVERGEAGDLDAVLDLISARFDPLAEHLPEGRELAEALVAGRVLVRREAGVLLGFLLFENLGFTSLLRFVAVKADARGNGVGRDLINAHLAATAACKRHQLWVWDANEVAKRRYDQAGYRPDGMIDEIYRFAG